MQTAFSWDGKAKLEQTQAELRDVFARAVLAAGGVDWLTTALNEKPSYVSKITEAIQGGDNRKVQFEWLAPLLDDPNAAAVIVTYLNHRCGFADPVVERDVDPADEAHALREEIDGLGELKEILRARVAKRLGVRVEKVRL